MHSLAGITDITVTRVRGDDPKPTDPTALRMECLRPRAASR